VSKFNFFFTIASVLHHFGSVRLFIVKTGYICMTRKMPFGGRNVRTLLRLNLFRRTTLSGQ
jgi:hypothetical protein